MNKLELGAYNWMIEQLMKDKDLPEGFRKGIENHATIVNAEEIANKGE